MLLGKRYQLTADELNIILSKSLINKKAGKQYWYPVGYYATVKGALKDLSELKIRETGLKDVESVMKKMDRLEKFIDKVVPGIVPDALQSI